MSDHKLYIICHNKAQLSIPGCNHQPRRASKASKKPQIFIQGKALQLNQELKSINKQRLRVGTLAHTIVVSSQHLGCDLQQLIGEQFYRVNASKVVAVPVNENNSKI